MNRHTRTSLNRQSANLVLSSIVFGVHFPSKPRSNCKRRASKTMGSEESSSPNKSRGNDTNSDIFVLNAQKNLSCIVASTVGLWPVSSLEGSVMYMRARSTSPAL